jgi:hypothetical protein
MKQISESNFLKQLERKITTSEAPISDLEQTRSRDISNFYNIFQPNPWKYPTPSRELSTFQSFFDALFFRSSILHFRLLFFASNYFSDIFLCSLKFFKFFTVFQKISELYTTHSLIGINPTQVNQTFNQFQTFQFQISNSANDKLFTKHKHKVSFSKQDYLNVIFNFNGQSYYRQINPNISINDALRGLIEEEILNNEMIYGVKN